jgi:ABC-2 type transport system ATP-binding protein
MDDNAISIQGVSKDFILPHEKTDSIKSIFAHPFKKRSGSEKQHALRDISFDIKKGEFFGIVGRNGSGKSTLLKMIAGIYKPSKGKISVNGRLVPFIELGVGFNPELTGRENVYLNGALMGFSRKEITEKYSNIVKFAELERFMDQKLKNYSSGMQVRLAFSVATKLGESDILLIDEVLAVGDADFQRKCFEYFNSLKRNKKTVIFISHDMSAVREYCDRVALIDDSRLLMIDSAEVVSKKYTQLFMPDVYEEELRLANDEYHEQNKDKNKGKWGIGGVDITDLEVGKRLYEKEKDITISYSITPDDGFDDTIIPGITIKDEKGQPICGTNSKILKYSKKLTTNGTIKTTWVVPNIFNEGRYFVEPAVISASSQQTLQWWNDATSFRVINESKTPYVVAPRITLKVN